MLPGLTPFLGAGALAVTVAPPTGQANRFSSSDGTLFVTTVSGGAGGYIYAWEYFDGSADFGPTAPTSAQTRFTFGGSEIASSRWRARVTDAAGTVAYSELFGVSGLPV